MEELEREARIVTFESKGVSLSTKVEKLEYTTGRMEQYSRRNLIWIHFLPKEKGEDTDSLDIKTVKKMGLYISSVDIDRTHWSTAPPLQLNKVRPFIVKFPRYNYQRNIYINEKLLKGTKVSITA